ncbi:MAG: hypothetical protein ACRD2F_00225 [Terriglobales bacterium]
MVVRLTARYPVGLQPGFFVAPVAIAAWLLSRSPRRWVTASLARECVPVYLFIAFSCLSAIVFPIAFQGLLVESPRGGVGAIHLLALHLSATNLSAAAYLVCCALVFAVVVETVAASPDGAAERELLAWALAGISCAAVVGIYQVLAGGLGLGYPHAFFNSDPAYAQLYRAAVAGQARLTGTFTEASVAAWFFGAATAYCVWQALFARGRGWHVAALAACAAALALTAASTGYAIGLAVLFLVALRVLLLRRVTAATVGALMVAAALLAAGAAWASEDASHVRQLLRELVFGKWRSASYLQRSFSNRVAWHVFLATRGLGSGLGSLRASSLAATLLGTVGVIGVLLALWFALRLVRLEWRIRSLDRLRFPHREGLIAALAVMIGAGFLSVTDMVFYLPFWAFLGIYVATAWREACRRSGLGRPPGRGAVGVGPSGYRPAHDC